MSASPTVPPGVRLSGHRGPVQQQAPPGATQGHPQERHRTVSSPRLAISWPVKQDPWNLAVGGDPPAWLPPFPVPSL